VFFSRDSFSFPSFRVLAGQRLSVDMSLSQVSSEQPVSIVEPFMDIIVDGSSIFVQELVLLCMVAVVPLAWRFYGPKGAPKPRSPKKVESFACHDTPQQAPVELAAGVPMWRARMQQKSEQSQQAGAQRSPVQPRRQQQHQQQQQPQHQEQQADWVQSGERKILQLLSSKEYMRALNCFRSLERREPQDACFSEEVFSALIQASIRVGHIDVVERVLQTMMRRFAGAPSLDFWQLTVKMLSSRRHFATCVQVHTMFKERIPHDKIVYSCLVNAALEMGAPDSAMAMMPEYEKCDLQPKDYVVVFRTYLAAKEMEAAKAVFRKLRHETTPLMFNLMLLTCVNNKKVEDALELLDEAKKFQASDTDAQEGGTREPVVDVVSYNTVMKGFAQLGMWRRCFECIGAMMDSGLQPDDVSFGTLLEACICDDALDTAGSIIDAMTSRGRPLDTVTCTVMIKGLLRSNQLQKALAFYDEMKQRDNSKPDIVTYSMLMKACVCDMPRVMSLLDDFMAAGHAIDDIILTHLLEACRLAGDLKLGMRFFDEAIAAGVSPSDYTLATLLKLLGSSGEHQQSYELLVGWEAKHRFKPSVLHYTCVMSGCLRSRNYDQAWATYELMSQNGVMPDEMAVATLMRGLVTARQWERVIDLTRRARRATPPIHVSPKLLGMAIDQVSASGQDVASLEQLQILRRSSVGTRVD